ncbi:MAG: TolC family protein [Desulfobacteraceae bacterium]|nr:MAG: TolC family protein [Desulfobacteraceae bacterium]
MTRIIFLFTWLLMLVLFVSSASETEAANQRVSLDALVQEAVENNPEILALKKKHEVYLERVPRAGALEDPMLGLGIVNLPNNFSFTEEDMTMKEVSISQVFPFPGKRAAMRNAAGEEAQAVSNEVEEKAVNVIRDVKNAYLDLSHIDRSMEVTERNKSILESLARIAESRYSVGEGIQQDVLKARVEISRMVDDLIMLAQQRVATEAKLCSLLNRSGDCLIGRPEELHFQKYPITIQSLQGDALEANPTLARMKNMIEAKEKELRVAKLDYYPDFRLRFAYGQRDNGRDEMGEEMYRRDVLTGMVEINLPIFYRSKQDRRVAEALSDIRSVEAQYNGMKNEIFYMIASMASMAGRAERQLGLYQTGIIPQAGAQVKSALSAYTVNKVDFMSVLDAQMTLYRYELDYHGALTEYEKNLASLEAAVGKQFERK